MMNVERADANHAPASFVEEGQPQDVESTDEIPTSKNMASIPRNWGRRILWMTGTIVLLSFAIGIIVAVIADSDHGEPKATPTEATPPTTPTEVDPDSPSTPAPPTTPTTPAGCPENSPFCFIDLGPPIHPDLNSYDVHHYPWNIVLSESGNVLAVSHQGQSWARIYRWNENSQKWEQLGDDLVGQVPFVSLALSKDGNKMALGGPTRSSSQLGGSQNGHVLAYELSFDDNEQRSYWQQRGDEIVGDTAFDHLGTAIHLSDDGDILAVGAPLQDFNDMQRVGQVRVYQFVNSEQNWRRLGLPIIGEEKGDQLGTSVSLSDDGFTLAVAARFHDGDQEDGATNIGHVQVYQFAGGDWNFMGASLEGSTSGEELGYSVALSGNGMTLAVGTAQNELHLYQYQVAEQAWTLSFTHSVDDPLQQDLAFAFVSLSSDGLTAALLEKKRSSALDAAAQVRIWTYRQTEWQPVATDLMAEALALSGNGKVVAVAANDEVKVQILSS